MRDVLAELGLSSWVKTSGSKGFHIVVPLDRETGFDDVSQFAHGVGAVLVKRHPDTFTQEFIKADREGRILVDTGRNFPGATFAAVYAVRPKRGAPVSAPCSWKEIEQGLVGPQTFPLRTMAERMRAVGDLWADLHRHGQSLERSMAALGAQLTEDDWREARAASTRRPVGRKGKQRSSQ